MSGYDRHPDYGGPPVGRYEIAAIVAVWIVIVCGAIWLAL